MTRPSDHHTKHLDRAHEHMRPHRDRAAAIRELAANYLADQADRFPGSPGEQTIGEAALSLQDFTQTNQAGSSPSPGSDLSQATPTETGTPAPSP
jgi:hypothetical protein